MDLTPLDFFVKARFDPAAAGALLAAAAWYVLCRRRLAARGRTWSPWRTAAFTGAWLLVAVAVFSGLSAFARTNFSAYAAQYILVGMAAPALLALSAPVTLVVQSSPDPSRGSGLGRRPARLLAGPLVTFAVFAASVFVLFFTGVAAATIGTTYARDGVFAWMLAAGWFFLWPAAAADPAPRPLGYWPRILYLLLSFPLWAVLGMGLESQTGRWSPGISPASLHLGAAVIWVAGEALALGGVLATFAQWLRTEERRARVADREHEAANARQLALWRASREAAARAGTSP